MTARSITTDMAAAVQAETPIRVVAVEMDFADGMVRLNSSPVSVWIGGEEFLGIGALGQVGVVEEGSELASYSMTLALAGIPRDSVALALASAWRNRPGQVWEVVLDPTTWQPVVSPLLVFRGRMDQLIIDLGATAQVRVTLQNRLRDWERAPNISYTTEEQNRLHPGAGDTGFQFVSDAAEKQIVWPNRSFTG